MYKIISFNDDVMILEVWFQSFSHGDKGKGHLFDHLVPGFWVLQGSADKLYWFLFSFLLLDKDHDNCILITTMHNTGRDVSICFK